MEINGSIAATMEEEQDTSDVTQQQQQQQQTVRLLDLDTTTTATSDLKQKETLVSVFQRFVSAVFSPDRKDGDESSLFKRIKSSVSENLPLLPEASRNSAQNLVVWTREGSSLRALLVISVGTIVLLSLTGVLVFMLFFLAATINAVIISLLVSLAAAGGFLAIFFAFMTAIYISALSVAVFVISSATITTIFAVLVATGWIGFFWAVWVALKKGVGLAKHSIGMTGSALYAYSAARRAGHSEPDKD